MVIAPQCTDLIVGKTPPDERMLKEISSMLYRLPAASSREFVEQFEDSWGGVLLTSLYTEILKGAGDMQEVPPLPSYCSVLGSDFLAK